VGRLISFGELPIMGDSLPMKYQHALPLVPLFLAMLCCFAAAEPSPAPAASDSGTGIEGLITISPLHGGPVREGEPQSGPLPDTAFVVKKEDSVVTNFTTDAEGKFRVNVPPGHYLVALADRARKIGSWGPWPVDVVAGQMTKVKWDCDSGMR
jgi:hypothetical protein